MRHMSVVIHSFHEAVSWLGMERQDASHSLDEIKLESVQLIFIEHII